MHEVPQDGTVKFGSQVIDLVRLEERGQLKSIFDENLRTITALFRNHFWLYTKPIIGSLPLHGAKEIWESDFSTGQKAFQVLVYVRSFSQC